MLVREVMATNVEMVQADAPVGHAAERMAALDVGALPVWDGTEVIGMVTDRDITVRATAAGEDPASETVRDVMTPQVLFCFDDIDVEEASRAMAERQIRRLAVLNRDNMLVGLISLGDLASASDPETAGDALRDISQP